MKFKKEMTSSSIKSGLDFKNEGNELFQKRQFASALRSYTSGIEILTKQGSREDKDLEATLFSNRSGCYYEMGQYGEWFFDCGIFICSYHHLLTLFLKQQLKLGIENAAKDGKTCVQILTEPSDTDEAAAKDRDAKTGPLLLKNLDRVARALYFSNADETDISDVLKMMEDRSEENDEFKAKAKKMREQLRRYSSLPLNDNEFKPLLLRASLQDPVVEYFHFGENINNVNMLCTLNHSSSLLITYHQFLVQATMRQNPY